MRKVLLTLLLLAPATAFGAIEITPSSNYEDGTFDVTGNEEPGTDYFLYWHPATDQGCGFVTVPSTIDSDTFEEYSGGCSLDYWLATTDPADVYGTWRICQMEGATPEDSNCEDDPGYLSHADFTWLAPTAQASGFAASSSALVIGALSDAGGAGLSILGVVVQIAASVFAFNWGRRKLFGSTA